MADINRGIAPLDPTSDVGKVRLLTGDTNYTPLDPPEPGYGDYEVWSDDQIQAALTAGGSIPRAVAILYGLMAASWAATSATIKTDDLTMSAKDSVGNWLNLAAYWNKIADQEEENAINDYFDLVDTRGGDDFCDSYPLPIGIAWHELAAPAVRYPHLPWGC